MPQPAPLPFAVRAAGLALQELVQSHAPTRDRLRAAISVLQPVTTNGAGLNPDERERFLDLMGRIAALSDVDCGDVGEAIGAASESWVSAIYSTLRVLLEEVTERAAADRS